MRRQFSIWGKTSQLDACFDKTNAVSQVDFPNFDFFFYKKMIAPNENVYACVFAQARSFLFCNKIKHVHVTLCV